jgi:hypothetical protein
VEIAEFFAKILGAVVVAGMFEGNGILSLAIIGTR